MKGKLRLTKLPSKTKVGDREQNFTDEFTGIFGLLKKIWQIRKVGYDKIIIFFEK